MLDKVDLGNQANTVIFISLQLYVTNSTITTSTITTTTTNINTTTTTTIALTVSTTIIANTTIIATSNNINYSIQQHQTNTEPTCANATSNNR